MRVAGVVGQLNNELVGIGQQFGISIDPAILEEYKLFKGELVLVSSETSRYPVPARIEVGPETDRFTGTVRISRILRSAIRTRVGQRIELTSLGRPSNLESVTLISPIDVSDAHGLIPHISSILHEHRCPLGRDSRFFCSFPGSAAGIRYRVAKCNPDVGLVTEGTKIHIEAQTSTGFVQDEFASFDEVGGRKEEIALLRELVELPLQFPQVYRQLGVTAPRGIILYGPPGTGKTHLARAIVNEIKAGFYQINGPDIVGSAYGETEANLRRIFSEAAHHAPSVILIDELDSIAPHRNSVGSQSDIRMVTQLLALLDGLMKVEGLVVIGTTNRLDSIDSAFRRAGRFDREIFLGPPDRAGREEILRIHTKEMPLNADAQNCLNRIADSTHGFVGADLMELTRAAGLNALRRCSTQALKRMIGFESADRDLEIKPSDFDAALTYVQPSALRDAFVIPPTASWSDIGGLGKAKLQLQELIAEPYRDPDAFSRVGITGPESVLLHGPPGNGKTLLAHATATASGVNFISVNGPEVFTKWLGESEGAVRHVFRVARQLAPSIIFIDHLDSLAPVRGGDAGSRTTERVVSQLLSEMQSLQSLRGKVLVIGSTSRLDLIDESVRSFFKRGLQINVMNPSVSEITEVLKIHIGGYDRGQLNLDRISETLIGRSGSEIQSVCTKARFNAFRRFKYENSACLTEADFEEALQW